jgi:hypothetical protein
MSDSHLRPLGFGEILDGAFSLYRRNFGSFYLTALLPNLPVALFWVLFGLLVASPGAVMAAGVLSIVMMPVTLAATLLAWAALAVQAESAYLGRPVSWREGFRRALRRFPTLLFTAILVWIAVTAAALLFLVPGVLVAIMLFAFLPLVVLEGLGPVAALERSRDLARGAWGRIFGVFTVLMIIAVLPTLAAMMIAGTALGVGSTLAAGAAGRFGFVTTQLAGVLVSALTTPVVAAGLVLLYTDRRVRVDGLDLEVAARDLVEAGD